MLDDEQVDIAGLGDRLSLHLPLFRSGLSLEGCGERLLFLELDASVDGFPGFGCGFSGFPVGAGKSVGVTCLMSSIVSLTRFSRAAGSASRIGDGRSVALGGELVPSTSGQPPRVRFPLSTADDICNGHKARWTQHRVWRGFPYLVSTQVA